MKINFFKEASLPASPVADSLYFIDNGNYAEAYITSSTGVPKCIGCTPMIQNIAAAGDRFVTSGAVVGNDIVLQVANGTPVTIPASQLLGDFKLVSGICLREH